MKMKFKIDGLTIAVMKMKEMLHFYSALFDVVFVEKEMFDATLYEGNWGGFKLLFCPAETAKITATQNKHQFEIVVADLDGFLKQLKAVGGDVMGTIHENKVSKSVGVSDPDGNTITLKQLR